MSSLSPQSHPLPPDASFNSQQLAKTLVEEQHPIARLSQS